MLRELVGVDRGVTRVRHVVDLVEAVREEAVLVAQALWEDPEQLAPQLFLGDAVQVPEPGERAPAQVHGGEHVLLAPVDNATELVPVVDLLERHLLHGRAGDDEAVVVVGLELVKRLVELHEVVLGGVFGLVARDAHEVAAHLQRGFRDEAQDLGLGLDLGRHQVQDRHGKRANLLLGRGLLLEREDALLVQDLLGGKAVGNIDGHVLLQSKAVARPSLRPWAEASRSPFRRPALDPSRSGATLRDASAFETPCRPATLWLLRAYRTPPLRPRPHAAGRLLP